MYQAQPKMTFLPVDVIVDQKAKERHRIDTLNILAYVTLLIFVLTSTWYFKRRKILYIHETGLAIIFGMLLGASVNYYGLKIDTTNLNVSSETIRPAPPDYIIFNTRILGDTRANISHAYAYEFSGELEKPSSKLNEQIQYASVEPEIFFNIILPPILLNAGLSLKRRHFFRNIGAIFSFAFLGTTISVGTIGFLIYEAIQIINKLMGGKFHLAQQFSLANCLYFGAIISPTDPLAVLAIFQELGVDVNLFALVFGESILNDAVSIVLTHSIDQFSILHDTNTLTEIIWQCIHNFANMFFTSCLVGIAFGVITAFMTKFSKLHESDLLETSLVVLTSYLSFLTAEVVDASGIVAILLCGITQAHYTINNLSFEARERLKNLFELLTFLCENFLFVNVGVAFWQADKTWSYSFIGIAFVAIIIARALSIYPLSLILNLGRRTKIPMNYQHLIAWGGAARGVISYALAARNTVGEARRIILSTTSVIVIFSVIVVGGTAESLLHLLGIPIGNSSKDASDEDDQRHRMLSNNPNWTFRQKRVTANSESSTLAGSHPNTPVYNRYVQIGRHQFASPMTDTPVIDVERSFGPQHQNQKCRQRANANVLGDSVNSLSDYEPAGSTTIVDTRDKLPILAESEPQNEIQKSSCDGFESDLARPLTSSTNADGEQAYEHASLVRRWKKLDNNFIKPILTNSQPTLMDTLPACLGRFARLLTSEDQLMQRQMRQRRSEDDQPKPPQVSQSSS